MKHLFSFALTFLIISNFYAQQTRICEGMSQYNLGPITPQSSNWQIVPNTGQGDADIVILGEVTRALRIYLDPNNNSNTSYVEYTVPQDPNSISAIDFDYQPSTDAIFGGFNDVKFAFEFDDGSNFFFFTSDFNLIQQNFNTVRIEFDDLGASGQNIFRLLFNGVPFATHNTFANLEGVSFCGNAGTYWVYRVCYEVNQPQLNCDNAIPIDCGEFHNWDNFEGENNIETYCDNSNFGFSQSGNEVVYTITPFEDGIYTFWLADDNPNVDLDMFLFDECSPSFCLAHSDGAFNSADLIEYPLQAFNTYYLVVDGDDNSSNFQTAANYRLSVNCDIRCDFKRHLFCDVEDIWSNAEIIIGNPTISQPKRVSYYECPNNDTRVNYSSPEVLYSFTTEGAGVYTFDLDIEDFNTDLDIFILDACHWNACIAHSDNSFDPGVDDHLEVTLDANTEYCVVIDGELGATSNYRLLVTGCQPDLCDLVTPQNQNENYIEFDDSLLPNPATSFTVTYPFGATGGDITFEETVDTENEEIPYFYCPTPGCYYICFTYINEIGQTEQCCIKYCTSFRWDECEHKPVVYEYTENSELGIFTCKFTCEPIFTLQSNQNSIAGDSSYIQIIGENTDIIIDEDETCPPLPYGEYEICCYIYDEECDFWDVCCDIYCFPWISTAESCNTPLFERGDQPNIYIGDSGQPLAPVEDVFTITPNNGGLSIDIVPSPPPSFVQTYVATVNTPGVYKVCSVFGECCQYICWDGESNNEECFDWEYVENNTIELTCSNDAYIYNWTIVAQCPQPEPPATVICESWILYDQNPTWTIPSYGGEFEICKTYNDCCGSQVTCCEIICLDGGFTPYNEEGGFNFCDDISVDFLGQDGDAGSRGIFTYDGLHIGEGDARWEVWSEEAGQLSQEHIGSAGGILNTNDEGFFFQLGRTYFVCYSWTNENGCREYCCIKVDFRKDCSHTYNYQGDDLNYIYDYDPIGQEEIMGWTVSGDNQLYDSEILYYNHPSLGTYYVCCWTWNPFTKCYALCCRRYCVENPLECGANDGILTMWLPSSDTYNLTLPGFGNLNAVWQIDIPLSLFGTEIGTGNSIDFKPSDYGISPGTEVVVSVKYIDNDGCSKVCCKEMCSSGPDGCVPAQEVIFDIDETCGPVGSIVKVPIQVRNFKDIRAFNFNINIPSNQNYRLAGFSDFHPDFTEISLNSTVLTGESAIIGWASGSFDFKTVPDNTVIGHIDIEVNSPLNMDVPITGSNPDIIGADPVVGVIIDGSFCTTNTVSLSGRVANELGRAAPDVMVTASGPITETTMTDANGNYTFEDLPSGQYEVSCFDNDDLKQGVSIVDVVLIRGHFLQKVELNSYYKLIAGDVERNAQVNIIDASSALGIFLEKLTTLSNNTSWRFVPADLDISADPLSPTIDGIKDVNLTASISNVDFIAIKIADVTNDALLKETEKPADTRQMPLTLKLTDTYGVNGETISLPITHENFENITALGFELNWDNDFMVLEGIDGINLEGFNENNYTIEEGRMIAGWNESNLDAISLESEVLFNLNFRISDSAQGSSMISFKNVEATDGSFMTIETSSRGATIDAASVNTENEILDAIKVYPNPSLDQVTIELPESSILGTFTIYNNLGQKIWSTQNARDTLTLNRSNLSEAGIYFIEIQHKGERYVKKIIRL